MGILNEINFKATLTFRFVTLIGRFRFQGSLTVIYKNTGGARDNQLNRRLFRTSSLRTACAVSDNLDILLEYSVTLR